MRVVACVDRAAWDDFVAGAGGSLLQSWQWGEFKRRQGWRAIGSVGPSGMASSYVRAGGRISLLSRA